MRPTPSRTNHNRRFDARARAGFVVAVVGALLALASPASAGMQTVVSGGGSGANGTADPNTTVSPGGILGQAVITNVQPLTGLGTITGARWVSHSAAGTSTPTNTYVYTTTLKIPSCAKNATMTGKALGDDLVTVKLNGTSVAPAASTVTFTGVSVPPLGSTLSFEVPDEHKGRAGLDYTATVTWADCSEGRVKVCKVAGPGVPENMAFKFKAGGQTVTVKAGPGPRGFCKPFPLPFPYGTLQVEEVVPTGYQVVGPIGVEPADRLAGPVSPSAVKINVGSGITIVTMTNQGPGWMEVCKDTNPTDTPQMFTFDVQPFSGPIQTVKIPGGGSCSGSLQLAAGPVKVTEHPEPGWKMTGCYTVPAIPPPTCQLPDTATTTIVGGDISTETLLYVVNACPNCPKTAGPAQPADHALNATAASVAELGGEETVLDAAPDATGKVLYVTTDGPRGPRILRVPAAGGPKREILAGAPLRDPAGLAVSSDGDRLFVADTKAGHILVVPVDGGRPHVLRGSAGSAPRGLEIQARGSKDLVVYSGKARDGRPAVLRIAAGGAARPDVVLAGAPLRGPDGIAVSTSGAIYVSDHGSGGGRVLRLDGGRATTVATDVALGHPGGIALTLDESELVVSTVSAGSAAMRLLGVDLDSGATSTFATANGDELRAGGLHRALAATTMGWASASRPGKAYVVRPAAAPNPQDSGAPGSSDTPGSSGTPGSSNAPGSSDAPGRYPGS